MLCPWLKYPITNLGGSVHLADGALMVPHSFPIPHAESLSEQVFQELRCPPVYLLAFPVYFVRYKEASAVKIP